MTDTSLLSPEDQAVLNQSRQLNAKPITNVMYANLKFKDSEKKIEGLTRGNYYIESYDSEEQKKSYRDIGPNPEIIILHRCYTYSYYQEGVGLIAWTTDIQGFGEASYLQIFSKKDGKASVEFSGSYPAFKRYIAQNYTNTLPTGKEEKLMGFQNLLYVLFEDTVYRMFVSNASAAGIAEGEKGGDFKNPQPLSLISFMQSFQDAPCEHICKLGSRFKDDVEQPFFLRTFDNIGPNPDVPKALPFVKKLLLDASRQNHAIAEQASIGSMKAEVVAGEAIKAEDLPW